MAQDPGSYDDPGYPDDPDSGDRSRGWIWALVVVALAVVGVVLWQVLGSDEPDGGADRDALGASPSQSTVTETTTTTASPSPSETPDLEGYSTDPVVEGGFPELGDNIGYGTAVRVGSHEGYDRVTFEFSGSGTPSFQVQYTDDPRSQGSGDTVDVEGDAALQVIVTSVAIPDDPGPVDDHTGHRRHRVRPGRGHLGRLRGVRRDVPRHRWRGASLQGHGAPGPDAARRRRRERLTYGAPAPWPGADVEVAVPRLRAVVGDPAQGGVQPVGPRRAVGVDLETHPVPAAARGVRDDGVQQRLGHPAPRARRCTPM